MKTLAKAYKPDMDFTVIDITTNGLDEDSEIISFTALRFQNGFPTDRFFEYVNSGAVLSDSISEILGLTNDTLQRYGTTMEDAYWQFIEFCSGSDLVTMHHDFDSKFIERIYRRKRSAKKQQYTKNDPASCNKICHYIP